jgi:putative transposase
MKKRRTGPRSVTSLVTSWPTGPRKSLGISHQCTRFFSRYVVGWMIALRESAVLAERLIAATCTKQRIAPGQLTLHADRGSPMRSKPVALLLADLGVVKTHGRPHVSNDNPFSEAQFKTLKYCPAFPERFGSLQDARVFGHVFFSWYNNDHYHSGLGYLTPAMVHDRLAEGVRDQRQRVLAAAYAAHPERFVRGVPNRPRCPRLFGSTSLRRVSPLCGSKRELCPRCRWSYNGPGAPRARPPERSGDRGAPRATAKGGPRGRSPPDLVSW